MINPLARGAVAPRLAVASAIAAILSGCADRGEQLASLKPVLPEVDRLQVLQKMAPGEACLLRLRRAGAQFTVLPDLATKRGCGYENAVRLVGLRDVVFSRPAVVRCALALKVVDWVDGTVQPAAQEAFGRDVVALDIYSSYSCRAARGRPWGGQRRRLSQHAYGNALDIGGFRLAGGAAVAFKKDWHKEGPARGFLREVSARACEGFSKVFTPDHDWHHRHHVHLDLAEGNLCGMRGASSRPGPTRSVRLSPVRSRDRAER